MSALFPASDSLPIIQYVIESDPDILTTNEVINGRSSPEIWPEVIPGSNQFAENVATTNQAGNELDRELETNKVKKLAELQQLSDQEILHKMKKLKQRAYSIGLTEAKEVERSKMLNIFGDFKHQIN
ncbi:Oidioi.mRNA.OKI2018_I69.chr2.g4017.t1.cds [Oikopleura dioica]|uniref:Protein lin-52 homolog n=1 Tax=Oikopleura dioica TaxID=34765 RepID=A0ABN7SZH7_OIKDI|nr:Oidioi.mRNA.OKI2018_I69.chr2.g4017.t1.cds [Oikopleura dioica]